MSVTPRMLDWAINGVPVYIRRAPVDGKAYATTYDYSRFIKEPPLETVRLMVKPDTLASWKPEEDPRILAKLAEYNKDV
jgi:hypothetical protein